MIFHNMLQTLRFTYFLLHIVLEVGTTTILTLTVSFYFRFLIIAIFQVYKFKCTYAPPENFLMVPLVFNL